MQNSDKSSNFVTIKPAHKLQQRQNNTRSGLWTYFYVLSTIARLPSTCWEKHRADGWLTATHKWDAPGVHTSATDWFRVNKFAKVSPHTHYKFVILQATMPAYWKYINWSSGSQKGNWCKWLILCRNNL